MLTGRNTGPRAIEHCNASMDALSGSRRRTSDRSGPVPRFSRFVPDTSANPGEKWYNRGWYGHGCTSFPSEDFTPAKSTLSDGEHLVGGIRDHQFRMPGAACPARKKEKRSSISTHPLFAPVPSKFPSRSISASESGVTRKNRQLPCFDRIQSSAQPAIALAISRSLTISFL